VPIALEWIRESDARVIFWGRVEFELAKFDTTPKGRDGIDKRIARVVEPSTAEEAAALIEILIVWSIGMRSWKR
jgi:hypothetical protein